MPHILHRWQFWAGIGLIAAFTRLVTENPHLKHNLVLTGQDFRGSTNDFAIGPITFGSPTPSNVPEPGRNIDPGIKIDEDYWVYNEGLEKGFFCKRMDGPLMKGKVWPGDCNFPDFTNPEVRVWWAGLFEGLIETGVRGVWNDMNEPAVFNEQKTMPLDNQHRGGGDLSPGPHGQYHNVFGRLMVQASREGSVVEELAIGYTETM